MKNLLYIVAHPDDESLWVGGTISALNKSEGYNTYVLCLWGLLEQPDEFREESFYKATEGCKGSYVFMGGNGEHPIEPGLDVLKLSPKDVDLVITHPPYGDEHQHPHHKITHIESRGWANDHDVPLSCFSFFAMPFKYEQIAIRAKRNDDLHLLNLFRVNKSDANRRFKFYPDYFVQFLVNIKDRNDMLSNYKSIDVEEHKRGYFGWTSNCEGYYLTDAGLDVFSELIDSMPTPTNSENLYSKYKDGI
jgi:LmbE family N-acetylglucosaminyl deacetylase